MLPVVGRGKAAEGGSSILRAVLLTALSALALVIAALGLGRAAAPDCSGAVPAAALHPLPAAAAAAAAAAAPAAAAAAAAAAPADPLAWMTPAQARERAAVLALGGLCPVARVYGGDQNTGFEILAFIKAYALYWPRHLGFENLTFVFDDEAAIDHLEGAALEAQFPFVRARYEPLPNGQPLEVAFRGGMRSPGYNRQEVGTLLLDQHCSGAGVLAIFDSDAVLFAPVTYDDLFDAAGRVTKRMCSARLYEAGSRAFLRLDAAGVGPDVEARYPSIGTAMLSFPNAFLASTFALARRTAIERRRASDLLEAYRGVFEEGHELACQFDMLAYAAYFFGERSLYSWHVIEFPTAQAAAAAAAPGAVARGDAAAGGAWALDAWAPRCAAGPRDAAVSPMRHGPAKLAPWTEGSISAELAAAVRGAPLRPWDDLHWRPDGAAAELNLLWHFGACYLWPAASPACAAIRAAAPTPWLLSLNSDIYWQLPPPAGAAGDWAAWPSGVCRAALHVCAVARAHPATYGATRAAAAAAAAADADAAADAGASHLLYHALPASAFALWGTHNLSHLCSALPPHQLAANFSRAAREAYVPAHLAWYLGEAPVLPAVASLPGPPL
jgi:hypothetical protein